MSYGVSLESMMIPDVGNDYPAELAALENWVITMESQLIAEDVAYCAAMEAEGADVPGVSPSSFVTRIRTAFDNLRAGKKKGDNSAVAAATQEIQAASDEFAEEAEKETDPDKKKKWKKAAAIIAAIVGTLALAVGAVALAKNAKSKASSGNVSAGEAKTMVSQAVAAAQKADPQKVLDAGDRPAALPGKCDTKALPGSADRLGLPAPKPTGTGTSTKQDDGTYTRNLSRKEQKDVNRTKSYGTPNPEGNRAQRRASTFKEETPAQKKARLLREAAQSTAASGGTVSKETARRINNAEKKVRMQETANAHKIIETANQLRGEQKKAGTTPAAAPAENQGEIKELLQKVNGHFAAMKQSGGLTEKKTANNTFFKRTKQGDQAKVFKREIDGMAQAIARLTQLGYNGDAINMYNQLKKAQK